MKVDIIMPKMGESLQEGTITKWLKKVGDKIERDEMILEISTDKVDTEIPAPVGGVLANILAGENETIEVGTKIGEIETEGTAEVFTTEPEEKPKAEPAPEAKAARKAEAIRVVTPEPAVAPTNSNVVEELIDLVMPKMGESLQEGTITKWLKKVGDKIERDEMILEISTDKVDTEIPSPVAGYLAEILVKENETVEVGTVIAKISAGGTSTGIPKETKAATRSEDKATEPKAHAPAAVSAPKTQPSAAPVFTAGQTTEIPRRSGNRFYSPLVRTIAEENMVTLEELDKIIGTGIEGRVTKKDLEDYIGKKKTPPVKVSAPGEVPKAAAGVPKPEIREEIQVARAVPSQVGADSEIIPMDRVRQLIAQHMKYSIQTSAHVTSVAEADVTGIVRFRKEHADEFLKREGIKLTFTPFFVLAVVEALKQFPMINVSVDGNNIIKHNRINIGIATALPDNNLIVPVIKNADALSLTGIARAVTDLSGRARKKKLNPDDILDGTFTITNYGVTGTLFGTPIINQPQCAILGLGAIQKRPVAKEVDGEWVVVPRDMTYLSLVFDHRVIDGMLAGQALWAMVKALEAMNNDNLIF